MAALESPEVNGGVVATAVVSARPPAEVSTGWRPAALRSPFLRAASLVVIVLLGYHDSLLGPPAAPYAGMPYAAVLGGLALLMAVAAALIPRSQPDIHDGYLDYIVGVPLIGLALAILFVAPGQFLALYQVWRLDLLSLALFCAGTLPIVFGVRALWTARQAIAFLFLGWVAVIAFASSNPSAPPPAVLLVLAAFALAWVLASVRQAGRPVTTARLAPAVRRPASALGVVLLAATIAAVGSSGLLSSGTALKGATRIAPFTPAAASVDGWSLHRVAAGHTLDNLLAPGTTWARYRYDPSPTSAGADPGIGQVVVDVLSAHNPTDLSWSRLDPIEHLLAGNQLDSRTLSVGDGLSGQLLTYQAAGASRYSVMISWIWPVAAGADPRFERLVLQLKGNDPAALRQSLTTFARQLVRTLAAGALPGSSAS